MINIDEAMKNNSFVLFYQPKIDINKNRIIGVEALIRLKDKKKYIYPNEFIPEVEKNGEIVKIDKWVIRKIIKDAREIFVKSNENISISFNISTKFFEEENFIKDLENVFESTKDFLSLFEIEITESGFLKDIIESRKKLDYLKNVGFKVSIDDFGVGYGCLTYLKELPIDVLKIDKIFIDDLNYEKTFFIVESLINLCKKLGIKSVAEGVEDLEQVEVLKNLGCDVIQGYYYAKPMPLSKLIVFLKAFNKSKSANYINWSNKYSTNSYAIDSQHMIIVNLINKMFDILKDEEKRKNFSMEYFIEILDEYLIHHFKMEETIMRRYGYPFIQKHINEHKLFLKEYNDFKKNLTEIDERNLYNFFNLLKEWFSTHEVKSDRKMVEYLRNKHQD